MRTSATVTHEPDQLVQKWQSIKDEEPGLRIRDAAQRLGVTECDLLATGCGSGVTRLRADVPEILPRLEGLGRVMGLTRNEHAVLERKGHYKNLEVEKHASLFLGEDIDMRMFVKRWKHAFSVVEVGDKKTKRSLQFFDAQGMAVHKVFLLDDSDQAAFESITQDFTHDNQGRTVELIEAKQSFSENRDEDVDIAALRKGWEELKDTHDFHFLMQAHGVTRLQAFRLVGEPFAYAVDNTSHRMVLEKAAEQQVPIMVFVGNPACIQIHTGPVHKVVPFKGWWNVMDPDFNLHMLESAVVHSFVVRKPTTEGIVTSLELYNSAGEQIVTFFGKRKPGIPELEEWRDLVASIPKQS